MEILPEFDAVPHLSLIADPKRHIASLGQNTVSDLHDDTARKIAELYMGCLQRMLEPRWIWTRRRTPRAIIPDVILTVEDRNSLFSNNAGRWQSRPSPRRTARPFLSGSKTGLDQINDPKCLADKGMVVINVKSALDHAALWNASFLNLASAITTLRNQIERLMLHAADERPQEEWDALFTNKVVRPVLLLGQSLVSCQQTPVSKSPPASSCSTPMGRTARLIRSGTV